MLQTDSDSASVISLSSSSNISLASGVVPSSQNSNDLNHLSYANVTADISPRRSDDLGNQVRNSLELKQVQHIRSPENHSFSNKRQSSIIDENDPIELHMTSDASKSRISENINESKNNSNAKRKSISTNSLSNFKISQNENSLTVGILKESNVTKRKQKSKYNNSSMLNIRDNSRVDDSKVTKTGRKSSSSSRTEKKSITGSICKITDFLQTSGTKENNSVKTSQDKNSNETKTSVESDSFRLHMTNDESKNQSSATNPNPIVAPITDLTKLDENITVKPAKPKKRRLYDPSDYDLDELNIRWSQEPKTTFVELPSNVSKKYRVEIPANLKTPRNLTSKAKKYLQNSNTCSSSCSSGEKNRNEKTTKKVQDRRKSIRNTKDRIVDTSSEFSDENQKIKNSKKGSKIEEKMSKTKKVKQINTPKSDQKTSSVNQKVQNEKILESPITKEKISETKKTQTEKKIEVAKVDRRRSVRLVNKISIKPTPDKSTSSGEYYSLEDSKSSEKDPQVPEIKGQSIRRKLWDSPDKPQTKEVISTPRRSTRISIMKTPNNKDLFPMKVLETPKSVGRVKKTLKTPNTISKSRKLLPDNASSKTQKTKENGDGHVDDEITCSNMSRVLDKLISKEVSGRRSTFEFETPIDNPTQLKPIKKKEEKKYGTIVCTRLHRQETEVFVAVVRRLGKWFLLL